MVAVGVLLGRKNAPELPNTSFIATSGKDQLARNGTFNALQSRLDFEFAVSPGFSYEKNSFSRVSAGIGSVTIRYDKATDSYLLLDGSRQIHYSAEFDRFNAMLGTESASWNLSGSTSYVHAGMLEHLLPSATAPDYRYSYQIVGMPTGNSDLIRAGGAAYRINVAGRAADNAYANPMAFSGEGELAVALASGDVTGSAWLEYVMERSDASIPPQYASGHWSFNGNLASGSNLIEGDVTITGIGNYSGSGTAQIFGPEMEEAGGVFTASRNGGNSLAGYFIGARDPVTVSGGGIAELAEQVRLHTISDTMPYNAGELVWVAYDPERDGYYAVFKKLDDPSAGTNIFSMLPAYRDGGTDSTDYYNSRFPGSEFAGEATVEKIGLANPRIQLTYMTIGDFLIKRSLTDGALNEYHVFATGIRSVQPPTSGTASYSGIVGGFARVETTGANENYAAYRLAGDSTFTVNFGSKSISSSFSNLAGTLLLSDSPGSAATRMFSDIAVSGSITGDHISGSQSSGGWASTINGGFFGPDAQELGGVFTADFGTNSSAERIDIDGSFAAVKN